MNPLAPDPIERYESLAEMRSQCPVHQLAAGRYMAVDHDSVSTGLRSIEDFGGSAGQKGLPEDDTSIAGIPEPRHGIVRRLINSVVAFHKSQQIEPYLKEFIKERMNETLVLGANGANIDVMPVFVDPIPPAAMARLLGFPERDSAQYFRWGEELGEKFGAAAAKGESISLAEACPSAAAYVDARIGERLEMAEEDYLNDALSRFLTTDVEGERLSRRAITTQIIFAIGAGSDTTRNTLGSLLYRLAGDPETYARIRSDRSLVEVAVEEALRIDAPAQFLVRQCLAPEFNLGGTQLHRDDVVMLSIGAANRDAAIFAEPNTFDIDRPNLRDHLSFGTGPHICPGTALARLELRTALETWCDAVAQFELAADFEWIPPRTGMLHGPSSLSLVLNPA